MAKKSAGILLYRVKNKQPEVFLGHPGGPFFKNKDIGVWSIPKGEFDDNEDPLRAAQREFKEETKQIVFIWPSFCKPFCNVLQVGCCCD